MKNRCRGRRIVVVALALIAAGCGSRIDSSEESAGDGASYSVVAGPSFSGLPVPADASFATSFTSAQVRAALSRCALPHGPVHDASTQAQGYELTVGSWLSCSPSPRTMFAPGVTLAPDGTYYRLLPDGNGGLTRGVGLQNQGTWVLDCANADPIPIDDVCPGIAPAIELLLFEAGGDTEDASGCSGSEAAFEDSPRRMYLPDGAQDWCAPSYSGAAGLWLVPLR